MYSKKEYSADVVTRSHSAIIYGTLTLAQMFVKSPVSIFRLVYLFRIVFVGTVVVQRLLYAVD